MIYYNGDTIERDGHKFTVNFPLDEIVGKPWEDGDVQGIVDFQVSRPKKPGERVLFSDRRHYKTFFDWQGTVKKAREQGWGIDLHRLSAWAARIGRQPTKRMIAEAAAEDNFKWMRRWMREEWEYVGIQISTKDGVIDTHWGYDTDGKEYLSREVDRIIDSLVGDYKQLDADNEEIARQEKALDADAKAALVSIKQSIDWSHFTDDYKLELNLALSKLAERAGLAYPPE